MKNPTFAMPLHETRYLDNEPVTGIRNSVDNFCYRNNSLSYSIYIFKYVVSEPFANSSSQLYQFSNLSARYPCFFVPLAYCLPSYPTVENTFKKGTNVQNREHEWTTKHDTDTSSKIIDPTNHFKQKPIEETPSG